MQLAEPCPTTSENHATSFNVPHNSLPLNKVEQRVFPRRITRGGVPSTRRLTMGREELEISKAGG
jgi:hypothetical protein